MKRCKSTRTWAIATAIIFILTGLCTRPASADDAGLDLSPIATLLPDSQTAPAPAWLKPGMKITLYCASASIRGSRGMIIPAQPHERDAFQDGHTGEWFKEVEVHGTSGQSYVEVLVAGIVDGQALLQTKNLLIEPGALCPVLYSAALTRVGNGLEIWVNPDVLNAQARHPIHTDDLWTLPVMFPLNGKNFNALRIQSKHGAYVYDLDSGVLVWESASAKQGKLKYYLEGEGPRDGSTVLALGHLVNSRQVQFPWSEKPAPPWIAQFKEANFVGKHTDVIGASFTVPIPETVVYEVSSRGPGWIRTAATVRQSPVGGLPPPPPETTDGISASAGAPGSLFLPPAGLAGLHAGQKLDDDPTTKSIILVDSIVRRNDGATVVLSEQGPGYRTDFGYDQGSGLLNYIMIERHVGIAVARDTFNLTGWR